jgi:hypothetical protein
MQMWIDLVLDEDIGVAAEVILEEPLIDVGMDRGFEKPYPTIYVLLPVFGTSEFGEPSREIVSPVFYHVIDDFYGVDFVTAARYREHADVSVTIIAEAVR